jgi:predicted nucleic acid-binding protein
MIHLDTNFLVELVTVCSDGARQVRAWRVAGREVGASAIAAGAGLATRNRADFARFVPLGLRLEAAL